MNIVWFSWKDIGHPQAGGAEAVSDRLRQRLAADGHNVKLVTAQYSGSSAFEKVNGTEVYRTGNRATVYLKAFWLFRRKFKNWPDLIIDEMNTIPFGCAFYSRKKTVLLSYQLARKIWFYQMPLPLSLAGFCLEPVYLFLLAKRYKLAVTESKSTQADLVRFGFNKESVKIFRIGINFAPVTKPFDKEDGLCIIFGSIRPMKQTLEAVKAFEYARDNNLKLKLIIAGDQTGSYAQKVMSHIETSKHKKAIKTLGYVSNEERVNLMRRASVILVTSVKEGWGLIVTEANSQGTPAVVYDTDGLRDSVIQNETGLITAYGEPNSMGEAINELLNNKAKYLKTAQRAYKHSQQFTYENSYNDFCGALNIIKPKLGS